MEVLGENNKALSEKQLCLQLQSVIKESASSGPEIGVLTTENRDTWGKVYHELIKGLLSFCSHLCREPLLNKFCH